MKKTQFTLMIVAVVALGVAGTAHAQSLTPTIARIPFSFVVSGKLLPAGTYRITTTGADLGALMVENIDKGPAVFVDADHAFDPGAAAGSDAVVMFKTYEGQRFLWRVVVAGSEGREVVLHTAQMDRVLAKLNLLPSEADVASK